MKLMKKKNNDKNKENKYLYIFFNLTIENQ